MLSFEDLRLGLVVAAKKCDFLSKKIIPHRLKWYVR